MLKECFVRESEGLVRSWQRYDRTHLRDYLVQGVEDPRINVQSILSRHFLIERLFGNRFAAVAEAEMQFALTMNWLMTVVEGCRRTEPLGEVLDALQEGRLTAGDIRIPGYVQQDFNRLPCEIDGIEISHYINEVLMWGPAEPVALPLPDSALNTFAAVWKRLLAGERPERVSVIEPACGSANDYRFLHAFGIAPLIDYHGFDLCQKNVANARAMFADASFACGNALAIDRPDKSFDVCFVHDLFEHLSLAAMEWAMDEIVRVTRKACCFNFFNTCNGPEHIKRPVDDFHWNTLSVPQIERCLRRAGCDVEIIGIDAWLRQRFQCADTHNKGACTIIGAIKS